MISEELKRFTIPNYKYQDTCSECENHCGDLYCNEYDEPIDKLGWCPKFKLDLYKRTHGDEK
jgi:hypothetical protein